MSSYVIDKKEYVKAAGFIAGFASVNRVWVYDYENNRNSTDEDYYRRFVECYQFNAESVRDQYRDEAEEQDFNTYVNEFNEYKKIGRTIGLKNEGLKKAIMCFRSFTRSALYQTEDELKNEYMEQFFNRILNELMPYLYRCESDCWGEFTLESPKTEAVLLF